MAAKPPKPPGSFLNHSIFNTNSNKNKNNSNNGTATNNNEESGENKVTDASASGLQNSISAICAKANDNCNNLLTSSPAKKANCNCTNITIMHLFHEMKQEFPTIPDTIVAQCVNENCHQRENCIQMLRHELELNPIPVQSYPAKVLHPPTNHSNNCNSNSNSNSNNNNHFHHNTATTTAAVTSPQKPPLQQKPVVQHRPPLKPPLRPVRPAPLQPPSTAVTANRQRKPPAIQHSKSPLLPKRSTSIPNQSAPPLPPPPTSSIRSLSVDHGTQGGAAAGGGVITGEADINEKLNDMPAKTTTAIQSTPQRPSNSPPRDDEVNNNDNNCLGVGETNVGNLPRARPTTLNLNTQQQQQQRQLLNVQLQEHFQQQRKQQQQPTNAGSAINKPLRKAPLPPIAPKPLLFHHTNTNNSAHNHSAGDSLASPLSESEISVNVSLSTPSPTSSTSSASLTTSKTHHSQHLHNKSPIRHRSVITLQPEPPYTRDFLSQTPAAIQTPTTTSVNSSSVVSSPTNSGSSQKSYTSVNLTLRPPTTVPNSALQPSTIDITAGPGFSGASGGGKSLSYSSTSYDARLGYQQNFHITVTDEGGVFSASRRRPQQQQQRNQVNICEYENDGNSGGDKCNNNVNSLCAEKQQQQSHGLQHQQQQYLQQNQEFHNTDVVALRQPQHLQQQQQNPYKINCFQGTGGNRGYGNMCLAPPPAEDDAFVTETMERQKKRRDRLAAVLRENKKRLSQVEQEVNLITGPIPDGLSERLDIEIQKLRAECQAMLRSSNPLTQQQRPHPQQYQQQQQQQQQQFPPQPFPRQRSTRPPPPRQTSLDIIQHHTMSPSTPHTPASLPNFINTPSPTMLSSPQQQQQYQQLQHSQSLSPSIYQQQQQPQGMSYQQSYPQQHHNLTSPTSYADDEPSYYSDPDVADYEDDEDDEYEVVEHWECSMCTFRNHPQLNICECCDNVRIIPGTLTNLSKAISTNSASSAAGAGAAVAGVAGLTSVANRTVTDVNAIASSAAAAASRVGSMNALNTAAATAGNGNLEHDTNLAQQQLQHFALHT